MITRLSRDSRLAEPKFPCPSPHEVKPADDKERNGRRRRRLRHRTSAWFGLRLRCRARPSARPPPSLRAGDQNLISDTEKMSGGSDGECGRGGGGGDSLELVSEFRYAAAAPLVALCIPTYPPTIHGDLECNMGWEPRNQTQYFS